MHTKPITCTGSSTAPWLRNSFFSTDLVISMSGQTMPVEKKNLENFLRVHARMHLACTGNISLGPQRNILTFTYSEPARRDDFGKVWHLNGTFFCPGTPSGTMCNVVSSDLRAYKCICLGAQKAVPSPRASSFGSKCGSTTSNFLPQNPLNFAPHIDQKISSITISSPLKYDFYHKTQMIG